MQQAYRKDQELIKAVKSDPCICIIMPFDPKMVSKTKIEGKLKKAIEVAETELLKQYPGYTTALLIKNLRSLVASLEFSTHKISLALFVSSNKEKIYYLDMEVEERVIISDAFETRDIVLSKKKKQEYLLLVLSNEHAKLYLANGTDFTPLVINGSHQIERTENDAAQKVANFSDASHRKEVLIKKFIHHVDIGLSLILKSHALPLFVTCTTKTRGYFMQLSKNKEHVMEYIHGNYEDASNAQLHVLMQPYVANWESTKEKKLMLQLERAINSSKCSMGIKNVYKAARKKNGQLLLVEKSYFFPAFADDKNEINKLQNTDNDSVFIKDTVDDVIENILSNGGDIEFVSDGLLKNYQHIALIHFY